MRFNFYRFIVLIFLGVFAGSSFDLFSVCQKESSLSYQKPDHIDDLLWEGLIPYLLPFNHPIKDQLDDLFSRAQATCSLDTLEKAGFELNKHSHWTNVVVAQHNRLKGFLLKLYTDDQIGIDEVPLLVKRIIGADVVREIVNRYELVDLFKVPQKWLYPLPNLNENDSGDSEYQRRNFILVVEDMHILPSKSNKKMWKSNALSKKQLFYLHQILSQGGLCDSVYVDNIPFSTDLKIAFIDTEHYHGWPVPFCQLKRRLSENNQIYWESLGN